MDNLELLQASNITHDYPRHMHEAHSIVLILHGAEVTSFRGKSYTAVPGNLLLINAEEVHSSKSLEAAYRVFKISPQALSQIAFDLNGRNLETRCFPKLIINDPLMFRLLLDLHLKLERKVSALEQESEFISTIGLLLARQDGKFSDLEPTVRETRYVELIRDYLKAHYAESVSLAQLTSITNMSPFYLLRVFRNQVGFSPHEYQTQVRIAHARKLIRSGNSISQAALETGFFDQSHLSRNFKRVVGMTPGQYLSQSKIVQDTLT